MDGSICIVGIGNAQRGDDSVGRLAARAIKPRIGRRAEVHEVQGGAPEILDLFEKADTVILIDAVHSRQPVGTIHRFEIGDHPLPAVFSTHSSHAFSVAEAIELARAIGQLPARLILYGIEGKTFEFADPLSPAVSEALGGMVERIIQEVEEMRA